jgi:hypothetical protein
MPSKLYFFGGSLRPRVMTLIDDPSAPTGKAAFAEAGLSVQGTAADSYTYEQIPGRYVTRFFFKVADNAGDKPIVSYGIGGAVGKDPNAGGDNRIVLKPSDFKEPNVYQTFEYRWEYYEYSFMVAFVNWLGSGNLWWGGIETQLVEPFSDDKLMSIWRNPPKQNFYKPFPPEDVHWPDIPDSKTVKSGPPRVHMVEGMYFDRFGIEEAIRRTTGANLTESETLSGSQVADICPNFPSVEKLFGNHNVIVLANVDIRRLGVLRRYVIKEFVERGGGLLVLGGPWTYGRCAMRGTWIDEVLPVEIDGISDWTELPEGAKLQWRSDAPEQLRGKDMTGNPAIRYVHQAAVREGGKVLMEAAGKPVLVVAARGKGKVAAFLGTVMGETGKETPGFWDSNDWPDAMSALLEFLSDNKGK